ncbi:MAG: glycosyltransferase family 2 protein [Acetobacteraceae bacterium]|nr:glycosyltransferase family 2 protein [Acetobacteraceae bacterium]
MVRSDAGYPVTMARHVAGVAGPPEGPYDADIVILALDRCQETLDAIRSALAQEGVSRHLFVIDQGSHPDTLARFAAALDARQDATLLQLDRNYGVAGGRNRGAALGHGRVLAALDNDAAFNDSETLARAVAVLDQDEGLAAIGFRILVQATGADDLTSWAYPRALLPRAADTFGAATFVGAGHAIRRAAWDEAGGYDESLFFCWEEFDFCLRAIQRGWRIQYCGEIAVRHKVSPERRVAWTGARWFHFVRNRLYIARKWGASWPELMPRYVGYLVKGVRHGLTAQTLRALPAALRLAASVPATRPSPFAQDYLNRHDRAHRGPLLARLRNEVLAILAGMG